MTPTNVKRINITPDNFVRDYIEDFSWRLGLREAEIASLLLLVAYLECTGKKPDEVVSGRRLENLMRLRSMCYGVVQGHLF